MNKKPTPDELLAAYRTMDKMISFTFPEMVGQRDFDQWGSWVEAKRQIAIAASYCTEENGDVYDKAWREMVG